MKYIKKVYNKHHFELLQLISKDEERVKERECTFLLFTSSRVWWTI
jgi:hypothetical protein